MTLARIGISHYFHKGTKAIKVAGYEFLVNLKCQLKFMPEAAEYGAQDLGDIDLLLTSTGDVRVTAEGISNAPHLLAIVRAGAGFDTVDILACTKAAVAVITAAEAVRYPTAVAALTLILATANNLAIKDAITRSAAARWDELEKFQGFDLRKRIVGLVGFGSIGRELREMLRPLGPEVIAYDPNVSAETMSSLGVRAMSFHEVVQNADIVSVHMPLSSSTRHIFNREVLCSMKKNAIFVNTARGGIVDQAVLTELMSKGHLRAAGLDVLESEPPDPADPILRLANVTLSGHALNWTETLELDIADANVRAIGSLISGLEPTSVINPEVQNSEVWQQKLQALGKSAHRRAAGA